MTSSVNESSAQFATSVTPVGLLTVSLAVVQAKLREIGFITYALGKPLDPFIQVRA